MKIQPTFTAEMYRKSVNNNASSSKKHFSIAQSRTSKEKRLRRNINIAVGGTVVVIIAFGSIRKFLNRKPQDVIDVLNKKLSIIRSIKVNSKGKGAYNNAFEQLTKTFERPFSYIAEPDFIQNTVSRIKKAKSREDLLKQEEAAYQELNKWFNDKINIKLKPQEALGKDYGEILGALKKDLKKIERAEHKKIDELAKFPEEFNKKRNSKDIIDDFQGHVNYKKVLISAKQKYFIDKLNHEADIEHRTYYALPNYVVSNKNSMLRSINNAIAQKLEVLVDVSKPVLRKYGDDLSDNVLPKDFPLSIFDNKIFKFVSDIDEKNIDKSITELISQMDKKMNLKDFEVLINRLELRQALSQDSFSMNWYSKNIEKLKKVEAKVRTNLEERFYNSGKGFFPKGTNFKRSYNSGYESFMNQMANSINLTEAQEEAVILVLQKHADKMGFGNIGNMISYMTGRRHTGSILTNDFKIQTNWAKYLDKYDKTPICHLYSKVCEKVNRADIRRRSENSAKFDEPYKFPNGVREYRETMQWEEHMDDYDEWF